MEPTKSASHKKLGVAIGAAVVFVVAVIAAFAGKKSTAPATTADQSSSGDSIATENPATVVSTGTQTVSSSTTPEYKDGTYSATGSYISPGGPDQIGVTLTLKDDIITSVTATPEPGDGTSARYQAKFMSGYQALVVGQNIATLHLTKVSGSSLTPGGFDDALAQIKAEAQA